MKFQPKAIILGILLHRHYLSVFAGFEVEDVDISGVKKLPNASKVKAKAVNDVLGVHRTGTDGGGNDSPIVITSNFIHQPQSPRRRRLTSNDSIKNALNEAVASGILKPSFTLVVDVLDSSAADTTTDANANGGGIGQADFGISGESPGNNIFDTETTTTTTSPSDENVFDIPMSSNNNDSTTTSSFEIDITLANPSVTKSATYSIHGGPSLPITNILNLDDTTLLVSSKLAEDGTTSSNGDFCILAVDSTTGNVEGIIKKNGESLMNLRSENVVVKNSVGQSNWDGSTTEESVVTKLVAREVVVKDREWTCGVESGDGGRMLHEHEVSDLYELEYFGWGGYDTG
eukprot:scaffold2939_cov155-Alexandrium_tamarense.AAC.1